MSAEKIKFKTLTIYAKDYEDTILAYENFGFQKVWFEDNGKWKETQMKLSKKSDFSITIISQEGEPYSNCISFTVTAKHKYSEKQTFDFDIVRHEHVQAR